MISLIKMIIIAVFNLLPNSPFQHMFDSLMLDWNFMQYLTWFLPFDICANMMLAWLDCMLVYYVFMLTKKIVIIAIDLIVELVPL